MAELLLEIGLEEVPARMLAAAEAELGARVKSLLEREQLLAAGAEVTTFSTPRRLAVLMHGVALKQEDAEERLTGPAWAIAFKGGSPTPAAHAFARKAGVAVEQLTPLATPKGDYASVTVARPGLAASALLRDSLPKEIAALNWPKAMYWRAGKPERFVRPVKWLVALLDEEVLPIEYAGVRAGRDSRGHRVLHGEAPVGISSPAAYREALEAAFVMPVVKARRHAIRKALDHVTRTVAGARWREDEALVESVTHLTEWPSVILGTFASSYLSLPEEVLVTVMRDHQKYFAVEDASGTLMPHFLTVLNTATSAAGEAVIRHGNERVLRARFNDAQFFWDFDQRIPLAQRAPMLNKVTFQKDLGSYSEKTERTGAIAQQLASLMTARGTPVNTAALSEAVTLAKTDLTTELVKEFTELQGIIGGVYARSQGLSEATASAIYFQYRPLAVTDSIPPTVEGQLLGLADRIGTLADMFAIGLEPTGSKDPYALRRAGNAVMKILATSGLPLTLDDLLGAAGNASESLRAFLRDRLDFFLREIHKLDPAVVSAVLAAEASDVRDAEARALALASVRNHPDFASIAAAWKRTKNILRQAGEKGFAIAPSVTAAHLSEAAEEELSQSVTALVPLVDACRAERNYKGALEQIATLRPPIDRFFEGTMVLVDNPELRANRLALLQRIVHEFGRIADFSELAPLKEDA